VLLGSRIDPLYPQGSELSLLSPPILELILQSLLNPLPCYPDAILASTSAEVWEEICHLVVAEKKGRVGPDSLSKATMVQAQLMQIANSPKAFGKLQNPGFANHVA